MSHFRKQLIRIAYKNPDLRPALLPVIKKAEETEAEPPTSSKGGLSGKFLEFMKERGDDSVSNPNPKSRKRFPQVKIKSLSSSEEGKRELKNLFNKWVESQQDSPKPSKKTPATKGLNPPKVTKPTVYNLDNAETAGGKALAKHSEKFADTLSNAAKKILGEGVDFPEVFMNENSFDFRMTINDPKKVNLKKLSLLQASFSMSGTVLSNKDLEDAGLTKPTMKIKHSKKGISGTIEYNVTEPEKPSKKSPDETSKVPKKTLQDTVQDNSPLNLESSLGQNLGDDAAEIGDRISEKMFSLLKDAGQDVDSVGKPTVTAGEDSFNIHFDVSEPLDEKEIEKTLRKLEDYIHKEAFNVGATGRRLQFQKKFPEVELTYDKETGITGEVSFEHDDDIFPLSRDTSQKVAEKVHKDMQKSIPKSLKAENLRVKHDYMGVVLSFTPGKKPTKKDLEKLRENFTESAVKNSENSMIYDVDLVYEEKTKKVEGVISFEGKLDRLIPDEDGDYFSYYANRIQNIVERDLEDRFGGSKVKVIKNNLNSLDIEFQSDMDFDNLSTERDLQNYLMEEAFDEYEVDEILVNTGVDGTVTVTVNIPPPEKAQTYPL